MMKNVKRKVMGTGICLVLAVFLILPYFAVALDTSVWSTESQYVQGTFVKNVQCNLVNTGPCDAKVYTYLGYVYPGFDQQTAPCVRCSGSGLTGIGSTSYVPSGQDTFNDCDGVSCAGYYGRVGTESPIATQYCYDKADEGAATHDCDGIGGCQSVSAVCPDNANNVLQYSCGTCKRISGSDCTGTTLGGCTNYAAGEDTGLCRECDGAGGEQVPADDTACGTVDCDGMNYYYTSGTASAISTNYCKYRDYTDITSSRCEGLGDCKDANTGDCTNYADSTAATCGTCCYAQGACSSCTNYGASTQGPTADGYYDNGADSATGTNYCVFRDYHCTGSSCGETYADSTVATCGTCKYCNGASCANYAAGTDTGTCRECNGVGGEQVPADDSACGTIDCDGKNYYYQSGTQGVTTTETCKYRDYADITSNRCEGLGDCKDANSADCTSYINTDQYSCGTCKYISSSNCVGSTKGSCSNYGSGTTCGTCKACDGSGNCVTKSSLPGDNLYGCTGSNKWCEYGTCRTCGGYATSYIIDMYQGSDTYYGRCYYAGALGEGCDDVCASHGGVETGSWGAGYGILEHFFGTGKTKTTDSDCRYYSWGHYYPRYGPVYYPNSNKYVAILKSTGTATFYSVCYENAGGSTMRRVCACNQ